jgi:hypothetical protein
MAAANKKINIAELDFDAIKLNLKEFLRGQDEFQDYDFDGAGLSVILDILAYNTHYNAMYDNLAVNELFLDSARKRNSVVSRAKELGYIPRSAKCSYADVNISITTPIVGPAVVIIPAFSEFTTTIDGRTFTFRNREAISATGPATVYNINNVRLTEGELLSYRFPVNVNTRFIIPNANVDIDTLRVRVQENSQSSEFNTFVQAGSIVDVDDTSRVYWIKEIDDGLYELVFGDGITGVALANGNVVSIDYQVTSLEAPNGARVFKFNGSPPADQSVVNVFIVNPASGGASPEDIDSIKFNAPRSYSAQNRAVTAEDYKTIIYNQFPEAKSVTVWGGEDNNPPVYGKTFICIRPNSATKLTNQQKSDVVNTVLSSKNVVSVIPEIVDPEYLNIALDVSVYYNPRETIRSSKDIENIVRQTIFQYDDKELQRFDGVFRHSKLSRLIDMSEKGITNNNTTVVIRRKIAPRYNVRAQYLVNVVNPIFTTGLPQNNISSTGFFINGSDTIHFLDDDGVGNIRLFYIGPSAEKIIVDPSIGKVDYAAGVVNITNLYLTAIADIDFEISIRPSSYDVVSAFTQIAEIAREHLKIRAIPDETANGDLRAGKNYVFTSSRS